MRELKHTIDPKWIESRKQKWEVCSKYTITSESYTKKQITAIEKYFFDGDFKSLTKSVKKLYFSIICPLYPANSIDDVKYITHAYWEYADEVSSSDCNRRDHNLYNGLSDEIFSPRKYCYYPSNLLAEMFLWVFGEQYEEERQIGLEISEWVPIIKADSSKLAHRLKVGIYYYLYSENGLIDDPYGEPYLSYYFSIAKYDSLENFAILRDSKNEKLFLKQSITREFLLALLGYRPRKIKCNNIQDENLIKEMLFEKLDMPDEFYELVDYLKEHKRRALLKKM